MKKTYFDYASTTPVDARVVSAMLPFFTEKFGNASSAHSFGFAAQKALEDSRETIAKFLGARREEIVFTSGGTEANNLALMGLAHRLKDKGNHIIVSAIEHPSVLETARYLEKQGFQVTYLNVNAQGQIALDQLRSALSDQTILVSVMHASNEIGTVEPIAEIGRITRERKIIFHVDAVQTAGHLPIDVQALNVDLLSLSAHKFYGPKGVGALYVRKGVHLDSCLLGGDQEQGLRASTQNVAGAVGLAKAIDLAAQTMVDEAVRQSALRDFLIAEVLKNIDGARLNGHAQERLPNNAHFVFEKIKGEALLMNLDRVGIAASMGSACKAGLMEPSHVLRAIGVSDDLAAGALRISLGRSTTRTEIDDLLEKLIAAVKRLRA
ncbi:MAG: cysteine desulfurase [Candidatus Omnitrophica bacterium]|nr:cysteine desulfurase [Candidatus Omnitrophota bacterium]